MANTAKQPQSKPVRAPAKLSSGILGMKFMQKDDISAQQQPEVESVKEAESRSRAQHHSADPGEWFSPYAKDLKHATPVKSSNSVGFADLYEENNRAEGRRIYGQKPLTPSIEEGQRGFDDNARPTAKNNKKKIKKDRKEPNKSGKRYSEEYEEPRRNSKRRKS